MILKRQIAYPIIFFFALVFVGAGLLFLISYLLPGFLESKILSNLKKEAGISELTLDLRELDLAGANLGPFRLGAPQNPALVIRSIQVDYSPGGLYQKKIKKIVASGVEIYGEYKNGKLGLRGFNLEKFLNQLNSTKKREKLTDDPSPAAFPEHIEIYNATLICTVNGKKFRLPFEIDILPDPAHAHILKSTARLYPRGQMIEAFANIDLKQNQIAIQFTTEDLDLLRFADVLRPLEGLDVSGFASLDGKADLRLAPFKVASLAVRIKGHPVKVTYKNLKFQTPSDTTNQIRPFYIDIDGSDQGKWNIRLSDFVAIAPLATRISDMAGTVEPAGDDYKISGNFNLSLGTSTTSTKPLIPVKIKEPFALPVKFSGTSAKNGNWQFSLTSLRQNHRPPKGASFVYNQIQIRFKFPSVHLSGNRTEGLIRAAYKLRIPDVHITSDVVDIFFPQFVLEGKTEMIDNQRHNLTSRINLDLSGAAMTLDSTKINLNHLAVGARLNRLKNGVQEITGAVRFANTHIVAAQGNIRLRQAQGTLPLKFPVGNSGKKGNVTISTVSYQKVNIGIMEAQLQQTASGISFDGKLKSHLIPDLSAQFSGHANVFSSKDFETKAQFEISYPPTGPAIVLGKFLPAAEGFTLEGKFLEKGNLVFGKNGLSVEVKSSLSDAKLHHPQNKIVIEGIQLNLMFPELPKMRSAPGQQLRFAKASAGGLTIENGTVAFQIEPPRTLFIEKGQFSWSDGDVHVQSERISLGVENYNITLFCDRLSLAKVLAQFGAANAEGKGTVSGRISLQYKSGRLNFDDGFLFSSPGEGGKIRMKDTDILTAGIPPDSPQYAQMELARKALEDYDFSWAKLNITTEGEDLLLKMQLDGKPAQLLPFVYRKDIGGFAKVEAGIAGSKFQGIRLDVNFRLPLNKIMQYKELIQMIQKSKE
jgi:hypothetical protein